jgi:hypothetical protein
MTEDMDALKDFQTGAIPVVISDTPYSKIAKAAKLLKNDTALHIPISKFKTKNFRPSISAAGKKIGIKLRTYVQNGIVHVWELR